MTSSLEVVSPGAISGYLSVYPLGVSGLYPNGATQAITPKQLILAVRQAARSRVICKPARSMKEGGIAQQFPADSLKSASLWWIPGEFLCG